MTPGAWPILTPGKQFEQFFVEFHKRVLNAKYLSSRPYGFRQEDF